ncbi:MAG: flagellar export chaperone FliS [Nitrospirae bacterium]|nr:flagellar export chaperone FliS [Nitrospirota bacterium]
MNPNAAATYRQTMESTITPSDLLIRLYEGALRCVDLIRESMQSGDIPRRADAVNRLTGILSELASAVDGQEPRDLSESLVSLYLFLIQEVTLANVAGEAFRLDPVREILSDLLGTWRTAAMATRTAPMLTSPRSNGAETPRRSLSVRG